MPLQQLALTTHVCPKLEQTGGAPPVLPVPPALEVPPLPVLPPALELPPALDVPPPEVGAPPAPDAPPAPLGGGFVITLHVPLIEPNGTVQVLPGQQSPLMVQEPPV